MECDVSKSPDTFKKIDFEILLNSKIAIVCDDQKVNRIVISNMINIIDDSLLIIERSNGKEALDLYTELVDNGCEVHSILMDLNMPVMDGDVALTKMCEYRRKTTGKYLGEPDETKVVVITANHFYKRKLSCDLCGRCDQSITYKPNSLEELREIFENQHKS